MSNLTNEPSTGPYEPVLPRGVRTSALTQWTYDFFTSAQPELSQDASAFAFAFNDYNRRCLLDLQCKVGWGIIDWSTSEKPVKMFHCFTGEIPF